MTLSSTFPGQGLGNSIKDVVRRGLELFYFYILDS